MKYRIFSTRKVVSIIRKSPSQEDPEGIIGGEGKEETDQHEKPKSFEISLKME